MLPPLHSVLDQFLSIRRFLAGGALRHPGIDSTLFAHWKRDQTAECHNKFQGNGSGSTYKEELHRLRVKKIGLLIERSILKVTPLSFPRNDVNFSWIYTYKRH
jgi:hypothetical protein